MHYSKLATTLSDRQKDRQFQAFPSSEIIAIDRCSGREFNNLFFLNITKYCLNSDFVDRTTLKVLKLNHR